jgi:hypothetical protein
MNRWAWLVALSLIAISGPAAVQTDPWAPIRRMVGEWSGTTSGQPGDGTVARRYAFDLNDRYRHETNTSEYPPQERNTKGEPHEHRSLFSHDRQLKALALRRSHVEGFVFSSGTMS